MATKARKEIQTQMPTYTIQITEAKHLRVRRPERDMNGSIMMVSSKGKVWDCIRVYETEEVRYDEADWEEKFEAIYRFDSAKERERAVRENGDENTFKYNRSNHIKPRDNCRLSASLKGAMLKHLKWTPEEATLELQIVETHEGSSRSMATTNYYNLFLKFEPVHMSPLLPGLKRKAPV